VILVYVDDIILVGTCWKEFECLKQALAKAFRIKNLGELKFFVGLEVARSSQGISLCQRKYCLDLLADSGLSGCKPVSTPLDPPFVSLKTMGHPMKISQVTDVWLEGYSLSLLRILT